jgi:hypothetical protein
LTSYGAGLRYRLACGVGAAMRIWGTLLVLLAVAAGLQTSVSIPFVAAAGEWAERSVRERMIAAALVVAAIVFLVRPLLRHAMRGPHEAHVLVLPLSRVQRMAIDALAVAVFLSPLFVIAIGAVAIASTPSRVVEAALWCVVAVALQTAAIGGVNWSAPRPETSRSVVGPYEVRWLLRTGRFLPAIAISLLLAGCAELAIRNNDVAALHSIARIAGLFAALAAGVIAAEVSRSRLEAKKFRAIERSFPIATQQRVTAVLASAFATATPFLLAIAVLRPIALPYAAATLAWLVLLGEWAPRSPSGASAAAALLSALDARVALVVMLALVPLAWQWAVAATARDEVTA